MIRFFRLLFSFLCLYTLSCSKNQETAGQFRQMAEKAWIPGTRYYSLYSPGFSLIRTCLSEQDYNSWYRKQTTIDENNRSSEQMRNAYLDEKIRTPEQLLLYTANNNLESCLPFDPDKSVKSLLDERLVNCVESYIDACIKSGKYKEYLSIWNIMNSQDLSYGAIVCPLYYSNVSIVSLDIVCSETFFMQPPGSSLSRFFNVILFPSTNFLFDGDGNVVDEGPVGGLWYTDLNITPLDVPFEWTVNKFLSYKPRILPFGLQMAEKPSEHPSTAEFTVKIGYSNGAECSSTLSVDFPY